MTALAQKRVLITGAASGIGRLLAQRAATRGAHLILWDIDEAGLATLAQEQRGRGHKVDTYRVDLTQRNAIDAAAEEVLKAHGGVDVLVNNAGIVSGRELLEIDPAAIERTFQVNTLALFWTTRAFLPGMLERSEGHVVTVASAGGIVGTSKLTDYCSSKFAAVGFDESLRLELKRKNSRVQTTVVCPYYISTGMFAGVKTRFPRLIPILKPDYVADRVVRAIERNEARVITPRFVYLNFVTRLLPVRMFDKLMSVFGINANMDEFTGRQKPTPARAPS
ncbi:MAG: SDR family oxidoreductase [Planctomycetota bacterium]|jgi:all-trans-retinol dehydrogenase (NAD+)